MFFPLHNYDVLNKYRKVFFLKPSRTENYVLWNHSLKVWNWTSQCTAHWNEWQPHFSKFCVSDLKSNGESLLWIPNEPYLWISFNNPLRYPFQSMIMDRMAGEGWMNASHLHPKIPFVPKCATCIIHSYTDES